jgi:hypothetical protein
MKHLQLIVVGLFVGSVAGCNWLTANAPRPLGRAAMLELYLVSAAAVPNSQAAVAPGTGNTIYLVTPPIITSADVATVQNPSRRRGNLDSLLIFHRPAHRNSQPQLRALTVNHWRSSPTAT